MEVILAIIAVAVVAGLVYKFVSISKDTAVNEFPTTQPEAAPYKVEPAAQVSVEPKKVAKLEVVSANKSGKAKPKASTNKGKPASMAKPTVAPNKDGKTQGAKKPTTAPAQPKKNKTGSK